MNEWMLLGTTWAPSVCSPQAVQSVNMSHDSAHAQMDIKFRSLVCVGLKWVLKTKTHAHNLTLLLCSWSLNLRLPYQWAGAALMVGGVVLQHGCCRKMVSSMVLPSQSWMGTDQVWAQVRNTFGWWWRLQTQQWIHEVVFSMSYPSTLTTHAVIQYFIYYQQCNGFPIKPIMTDQLLSSHQGPVKVCLQPLPRLWATWQERGKPRSLLQHPHTEQ